MLNENSAKIAFEAITDMLQKGGFEMELIERSEDYQRYGIMYGKNISICKGYDYPTMLNTLITLITNYYAYYANNLKRTGRNAYTLNKNPEYDFIMALQDNPKNRHEYKLRNTIEDSRVLMIHSLFNTGAIENVPDY